MERAAAAANGAAAAPAATGSDSGGGGGGDVGAGGVGAAAAAATDDEPRAPDLCAICMENPIEVSGNLAEKYSGVGVLPRRGGEGRCTLLLLVLSPPQPLPPWFSPHPLFNWTARLWLFCPRVPGLIAYAFPGPPNRSLDEEVDLVCWTGAVVYCSGNKHD